MNIKNIFKLIRVPQWIKNAFVFVPLIFSKHIFDYPFVLQTLLGVLIFSLASSSVYVVNDIVDRDADRQHPKKKNRPVASGTISIPQAIIIVVVLLGFISALLCLSTLKFTAVVIAFIALNTLYSFWWKHIVLLDIFSIAAGFMLRVIAGAFVIQVPTSSWLILTTMFISLFLGVMKRRSELVLMNEGTRTSTRKVLEQYSIAFTDQMAAVCAAAVIISYALYSTAQRTITTFNTDQLIYTTPFVVFGIFRYMYLVLKYDQGENTTEIMLTDLPMILTVILYLIAVVVVIYR
jgi:4-hydroxybenzoate polyprenyltransferase